MCFTPAQIVGVPLLMMIPVLALFGTFDEKITTVSTSDNQIQLEVTYPERYRYSTDNALTISVENHAEAPLDQLEVTLSREFVDHYKDVKFTPEPVVITDEHYTFRLDNLEPGEARQIHLEFAGGRYGRVRGLITAQSESHLEQEISLFALP
jgi:hypothetical protein